MLESTLLINSFQFLVFIFSFITTSFFGNKKNDPILKGKSTVIDENNTLINKAVFSTCNIDKKKCRGWELNSDVFNHNKN